MIVQSAMKNIVRSFPPYTPHVGYHDGASPRGSTETTIETTIERPIERYTGKGKIMDTNRCIVRLRTSAWADPRGLHIKKSLTFLKRRCEGFNILSEDIGSIGAQEVAERITNIDECEDGIYEVIVGSIDKDWESGLAEDYDYRLVKTEKEKS